MTTDRVRTFAADHGALMALLDKAEHDATVRRGVRQGHRLSIRRLFGGDGAIFGTVYMGQDGQIRRPGDTLPAFEIAIDGTIAATVAPAADGQWAIAMETRHVRLAAGIAAEAIEAALSALLAGAPLADTSSAAFDAWKAEHSAGAPARHAWLLGALAKA